MLRKPNCRVLAAGLGNVVMRAVRIGLLLCQQGPAGLWGPSAIACAQLAVNEINVAGGLLGRQVELWPLDAGVTAWSAATTAHDAVVVDHIDALIGMFPSYARRQVKEAIGGKVPFIYTPQFEGGEHDPSLLTTGETSGELLRPAIEWLMTERGVSRFFLCGSDYLWPRSSFSTARQIIRDLGGAITGEDYLPLENHDFGPLLDRIRATKSDVVLPHFLGLDAVQFHRAFAAEDLSACTVRFASAVDETVIYNLDDGDTENLYIASSYFASMRSRNNGAFLERYHCAFGDTPPPANAYGQSCYEGIYSYAALVEASGNFSATAVRRAVGRARLRKTARGLDKAPLVGGRHPIFVARVEGFDLKIVTGTAVA